MYFTSTYLTMSSHCFLQFQPKISVFIPVSLFSYDDPFLWGAEKPGSHQLQCMHLFAQFPSTWRCPTQGRQPAQVPCSQGHQPLLGPCSAQPCLMASDWITKEARGKREGRRGTHYIWSRNPPLFYNPLCAEQILKSAGGRKKKGCELPLLWGLTNQKVREKLFLNAKSKNPSVLVTCTAPCAYIWLPPGACPHRELAVLRTLSCTLLDKAFKFLASGSS